MFLNKNLKTSPSLIGSEHHRPTKPNQCLLEDCWVTAGKRKPDNDDQPPRKRLKRAGDPSEVTAEAVTANGRKRKTVTETETPHKKLKTDVSHTGDVTNVSVIALTQSSDELPAKQSPAGHTSRESFKAKYRQQRKLGQGGYGSVYAGYRKMDKLPVAIKHIHRDEVKFKQKVIKNIVHQIPLEVLLMQAVAAPEDSEGKCAAVSLLDWYNLEEEVVLVMERPVPCVDLLKYLKGPMKEDKAKVIMRQLVEAAIQIQSQGVFHQDLKLENVLIETGSDVPRVRIIDFGCGCFERKKPFRRFRGTVAYCPPEYGQQGMYEARPATVWQLGALLYEILRDNTFDTCRFLKSYRKPKNLVEKLKVTEGCKGLLRMCLSIDPTCRASLEEILVHPWLN